MGDPPRPRNSTRLMGSPWMASAGSTSPISATRACAASISTAISPRWPAADRFPLAERTREARRCCWLFRPALHRRSRQRARALRRSRRPYLHGGRRRIASRWRSERGKPGGAAGSFGRLYIADLGNARVRCVDLDGHISTVAGGGSLPAGGANEGSPAVLLALSAPRNLAWDGNGNLYIADFTGQRVYRLDPSGALTTAAGDGVAGFSGDGWAAINARLAYPAAIAVDRAGTL